MDAQSRFIDVGSGLGKPNFHVAQSPGVRLSVGIELEHIRWQLAMYNLSQTLPEVRDRDDVAADSQKLEGGVHFLCGDIFDTATMVRIGLHSAIFHIAFVKYTCIYNILLYRTLLRMYTCTISVSLLRSSRRSPKTLTTG